MKTRDELHEGFKRMMTFQCAVVKAIDVDDDWYAAKFSVHAIAHERITNAASVRLQAFRDLHQQLILTINFNEKQKNHHRE